MAREQTVEEKVAGQTATDDDELKELLGILDESDDEVPEEVKAADAGDKTVEGKAARAFKNIRTKAKKAVSIIGQQQKTIEELKQQLEAGTSQGGSSSPASASSADAAERIYGTLALQAMTNLGIMKVETQAQQRLLDAEVQRLYAKQADRIERVAQIRSKAPEIVEQKLSNYGQLDEGDRAAIKKQLSEKYDVLRQTDDEVIQAEVSLYIGRKILGGGRVMSGDNGDGDEGDTDGASHARRTDAGAAAVSSLKTQGRTGVGVKPGKRMDQAGPQPATPEELREMRKLGMSDLAAYREAKKRKDGYKAR